MSDDRPTREECEAILAQASKASATISDLCHQRKRWVMSIPARRDEDPDLILSDAVQNCQRIARAYIALLDENANLKRKLEQEEGWEKRFNSLSADVYKLAGTGDFHHSWDAIGGIEKIIANLKRDKERLDWLEKNLALQVSNVKLDKDLAQIGVEIIFGPTGTMVEQDTLREAIDSAMESTASEGEPKA